jgi:hypothetical protein
MTFNVGIGAQVTGYGIPSRLESVYGQHPVSIRFFLRVRPTANIAAHMQMMHPALVRRVINFIAELVGYDNHRDTEAQRKRPNPGK